MDDLFPKMLERPENGTIVISAFYWPVCYILFPFVTTLLLVGSYDNVGVIAAVDIVCYVINAAAMIYMFFQYIKDAFFTVEIHSKKFFKTTGIFAGIMVFLALGFISMGYRTGLMMGLSLFPITETSVLTTAATVLLSHPLVGMLVMGILAPFTVSCMFYATAFAPFCCRFPRLAYLFMALLLLIPRFFNMWWLGYAEYELWTYFIQLPFHLLACWAYQKTDCIWAPIFCLSAVNLIGGGFLLLMSNSGMIWIA